MKKNHLIYLLTIFFLLFVFVILILYSRSKLIDSENISLITDSLNHLHWAYMLNFLYVVIITSVFIVLILKERDSKKMHQDFKMIINQKNESELRDSIFRKSEVFNRLNQLTTQHLNPEELRKTLLEIKENPLRIDDWRKIYIELDHTFNGFATRLRLNFPHLTEKDIQLCCLVKVKVDTTDISYMLQIEPRSVTKSKYRLKQKLGLKAQSEDLYEFLTGF